MNVIILLLVLTSEILVMGACVCLVVRLMVARRLKRQRTGTFTPGNLGYVSDAWINEHAAD